LPDNARDITTRHPSGRIKVLPFHVEVRGITNKVREGVMSIDGHMHGAAPRSQIDGISFTHNGPVCRQGK